MPSGTDLIQDSYGEIAVYSENTDISAFDIAFAKRKLEAMMQEWIDSDMEFGFTATEFASDETSIPLALYSAITTNLGIRLAPFKGKVANTTLIMNAKVSFNKVQTQYQIKKSANKIISGTTPIGSGNARGQKPQVFAGNNYELSDDAPIPRDEV